MGSTTSADSPPVTTLLNTCKTACEEVTPFVEAVYAQLAKDPNAAVRKEDKSFFSLADGVVQALFMRLLSDVVGQIVGEEDESTLDITTPPFKSGAITAPAELEALIVGTRDKFDALAAALPRDAASASVYQSLTAFIDPIDGTKEFCTGLGGQCSILIGFADIASGAVVGGCVYRPLCPQRSWALGCKAEGFKASKLLSHPPLGAGAFLCSNGGASAFTNAVREELGYELRSEGGAGNKALRVLEEVNGCYIQDRGVSRWDTCAPQAVLEAHGGCLLQLQPLCAGAADAPPELVAYKYLKGPSNADFVPGLTALNKYNAASGSLSEAESGKGAPKKYATEREQLKPYSNGLGLFALSSLAPEAIAAARAALLRAKARHEMEFD